MQNSSDMNPFTIAELEELSQSLKVQLSNVSSIDNQNSLRKDLLLSRTTKCFLRKMPFRKLSLLTSIFLFTSLSVMAPLSIYSSSIEVYETRKIARIDISLESISPNSSFDQKAILSRLKTKTGDPFSQLTFDTDLKYLSEEYDHVEPLLEIKEGELYVSIKLWPRPMIRSIQWQGNLHVKTKTLQKELGIKPHSIFNRQAFNKSFNKVKEYYIKKGYFESQLQYVIFPDPKTNEIDVQIEIKEGRSGLIDLITFKGFTSKEKSELLQMIYTKKYNLFLSWLTGAGTYNEEALEQDKLTIVNFLQDRGYADAKISIEIIEAKAPGKIIIQIKADRGPIYHLGSITFQGNHIFSDAEIENCFIARPEDIYSPEKLRLTMDAIKDLYGRKGYIDTNVQYEAKLVEDKPIYDISFNIDEGQEYNIGIIRIFGNVQTEDHVILRESLLIPGETFDAAKLKATQRKLENIGYFKSVNVYAVRTQDDLLLGDNYRDVYIEVEETTTGNLSLFFGFSTADSIFGGLDLSETNFNYKGIAKVFKEGAKAFRGGGEYARARVSLGSRQRSYSISWLTPYFRDSLWHIGFDLNKAHSSLQSKNYDIDTLGFSLYASYPLNSLWTFGTKYRVRNSQNHVNHHIEKKERQEADASGLISAIGSSLSFDSTDSSLKPHNGFRSLLSAEFAGLGGNFTFLQFNYLNTYYTQLWNHGIMKYRAEFKFIEPLWKSNQPDDIPISERFFLGGENTVRGYRAFDIGPHFEDGTPIGGISSSLLSIEYLHEIFRFLDGFLFIDSGSVSLKRFRLESYKFSYGFGARFEVINRVPITVGMGFPVNPSSRSEVRKFFFSMGGQF